MSCAKVFPAIDLRNGGVVRLTQGDYNQTTCYELNPEDVAVEFEMKGARYLHVVDLDGAKDGSLANFSTVGSLVSATDLFVEVGGGIRSLQRIEDYLKVGVSRVILGTAAVKDPTFLDEALAEFGPSKVVLGVDLRDGYVAIQGWTESTQLEGLAFCQEARQRGVETIICTDIACDGAMAGTNRQLYSQLLKIPGLKVVASGGISSLDDVAAVCALGVDGLIIGKALYEGALELEQVLACAANTPVGGASANALVGGAAPNFACDDADANSICDGAASNSTCDGAASGVARPMRPAGLKLKVGER